MKHYFSAAPLALSVAVGARPARQRTTSAVQSWLPGRIARSIAVIEAVSTMGAQTRAAEGASQIEEAERFRSADHAYDPGYGARTDWPRVYRDGFRQGYERGIRDYR